MKNTILFFALFLAPVFASAQSYITYIQTGNEKIPMMRVPSEQVKSPAAVHVVALQNELEHYHSSYLKGERIKQKSDVNPKTLMTLINVKEAGWKLDFYKAELAFYSDYDKELAQKERGKSQMAFIRKEWVRDSINQVRLKERIAGDSLFRAEQKAKMKAKGQ